MRTVFLLLVLANLGFYAWARYLAAPTAASDPSPLARQIDPEKLRVVTAAELARPAPAKPTPAPEPAAVTVPPAILACVEWGSFTATDAPRADKVLAPLGLGPRLTHRQVEETASWWVFMPPQGSRQGAQRKATELRALGITDFFVIQDEGPYRWALSLGVFRSEDAARDHLAGLRKRGVRTARIAQRELKVQKTWLQVESVDAALGARLKKIALAFPGSELRDCQR